jgi:hypothetical protein
MLQSNSPDVLCIPGEEHAEDSNTELKSAICNRESTEKHHFEILLNPSPRFTQ